MALYQQVDDPAYPLVCFDEGGKQLLGAYRRAYPARPSRPARSDYAYFRTGVCNLLMSFEPLRGRREGVCFRQRTRREWAQWVKHLVDDLYPDAVRIRLVLDKLTPPPWPPLIFTFRPMKRGGWLANSNCITPPNMAPG